MTPERSPKHFVFLSILFFFEMLRPHIYFWIFFWFQESQGLAGAHTGLTNIIFKVSPTKRFFFKGTSPYTRPSSQKNASFFENSVCRRRNSTFGARVDVEEVRGRGGRKYCNI